MWATEGAAVAQPGTVGPPKGTPPHRLRAALRAAAQIHVPLPPTWMASRLPCPPRVQSSPAQVSNAPCSLLVEGPHQGCTGWGTLPTEAEAAWGHTCPAAPGGQRTAPAACCPAQWSCQSAGHVL